MIVRYITEGWEIITQRSHGLLAAQICAQWKKENQPKRWVDTLIATAEHDDVYNEFENDGLLGEHGGPVDFKMNSFREDYCERLLDMALTKSRYIAILTSRHIQFLYDNDPAAKSYCIALRKRERVWFRETKTRRKDISAAYQLLEFCDAFSLLICQDLVQPEHRKIEISTGPDGKHYSVGELSDARLTVSPWPFEQPSFTVSYESRVLNQLVFKDLNEFRKAIKAATVKFHEIRIAKS